MKISIFSPEHFGEEEQAIRYCHKRAGTKSQESKAKVSATQQ